MSFPLGCSFCQHVLLPIPHTCLVTFILSVQISVTPFQNPSWITKPFPFPCRISYTISSLPYTASYFFIEFITPRHIFVYGLLLLSPTSRRFLFVLFFTSQYLELYLAQNVQQLFVKWMNEWILEMNFTKQIPCLMKRWVHWGEVKNLKYNNRLCSVEHRSLQICPEALHRQIRWTG